MSILRSIFSVFLKPTGGAALGHRKGAPRCLASVLVAAFCLMTLKSALVLEEGDGHCLEFGHIHYFKVSELGRDPSSHSSTGDCHGTQSVGYLVSLPAVEITFDLPQMRLVYHLDLSGDKPPLSPTLDPPRKPPRA